MYSKLLLRYCRKELRRLRGLSQNIECNSFLEGSALKFSFQVVPGSTHFDWGIKALNPKAVSATRIEEPDILNL